MMLKPAYPLALGIALTGASCTTECTDCLTDHAALDYLGAETRLLGDDIVNFRVRVAGTESATDVAEYAECVAAQYTLIRGFGFARHVRTTVQEENEIMLADAAYVISAALPRGRRQIDAEVVVAACNENGIPTV